MPINASSAHGKQFLGDSTDKSKPLPDAAFIIKFRLICYFYYRISISSFDISFRVQMAERKDQFTFASLIRLHILHHATRQPFFGLWIIEELREYGYKIGPGTFYPLLLGLERRGSSSNRDFGKWLMIRERISQC